MAEEYISIPIQHNNIELLPSNNYPQVIRIRDGIKITMRDYVYKSILESIETTDIQSKFKLNVKRLNRWWYSVYFDELEGEPNETITVVK